MRQFDEIERMKIERAAKALIEKYGIAALPKVVSAATILMEENKKKQADYWIAIADEIQMMNKNKERGRTYEEA
jgi:hypothetical protein